MSSIIIPLLILAIPIADTIFAILRRKLKGESISKPDKLHIHHQLLNRNLGQKGTVLIIYLATALFASASMIYVLVDNELGYLIYGVLLLILIVFALKTDIIIGHDNIKIEPKEIEEVNKNIKKHNNIKKKNNNVKNKKGK
jgi:UDP-GlcNAc:undecaprenyl-phosphate GlcNAc-1-phosphate transferase